MLIISGLPFLFLSKKGLKLMIFGEKQCRKMPKNTEKHGKNRVIIV